MGSTTGQNDIEVLINDFISNGDVVTVTYTPSGSGDLTFDGGTVLSGFTDVNVDTSAL